MRQLKDITGSAVKTWVGEFESSNSAEVEFQYDCTNAMTLIIGEEWTWDKQSLLELAEVLRIVAHDLD